MIANVGYGRWSGASSFYDCVAYGLRQGSGRPPLAQWCSGVSSMGTAAFEMSAVASQSVCVDPVYHLIVSWGPDERPSLSRVKAAVEQMREAVGLGGLQHVCMIHDDGQSGMLHVHDFGNRVDPLTLRARSMWRDEVALRAVCRDVEVNDSWRSVGSENVFDAPVVAGGVLSKGADTREAALGKAHATGSARERVKARKPGSDSRASESLYEVRPSWDRYIASRASSNARDLYGIRKRFRSLVLDMVRPQLVEILNDVQATWGRVHKVLSGHGMRYEVVSDVGARIVGVVSGFGVSLSAVGLRHREFVAQCGEWLGSVAPRRNVRDAELRDRVDQARSKVEGLANGSGWALVHTTLASVGIGLEKRLNGVRIVDLDGPGWLRIGRDDPVLSLMSLKDRFGDYEGGAGEVHRDAFRRFLRDAGEAAVERRLLADPEPILTTLLHTRVAVPFSALWQDVARRVLDPDVRERVTRSVLERMIAVGVGDEMLLTTAPVGQEERAAGEYARTLVSRQVDSGVQSTACPAGFSQIQGRAFRAATSVDGRLKVVSGVPIQESADLIEVIGSAYRAAGFRVRAVALTQGRVTKLTESTSFAVAPIGRELRRLGSQDLRDNGASLTARDVVIVDQAGSLGTADAAALLKFAAGANSIVVAIGIAGGSPAVARGDGLRIMQRASALRALDVSERPSYRLGWRSTAVAALDRGRTRSALDGCRKNGALVEHLTDTQALQAVVRHWAASEAMGVRAIIAVDNDGDRRAVCGAVRHESRALGLLTSRDALLQTMDGVTAFAVGDRIVMREAVAGVVSLDEGDVGKVSGLAGTVLSVTRDDGRVVLVDTAVHPGVQYAYASTDEITDSFAGSPFNYIAFLSKSFDQRRVSVGIRSGAGDFVAHYSREAHQKGYMTVIQRAERTDKSLLLADCSQRGRADVIFNNRLTSEVGKNLRRGSELGVDIPQ